MGALDKDRATERREGLVIDAKVVANDCIYGGSLACVNAAGYAIPGANAAGNIFLGVSEDRYDNTGGAAGAISGTFRRKGLFRFASISNLSIANMGDNAFVYDDQTVGLLADCNQAVFCGTIVKVEGQNDCWVDVEPATRQVDHTAALAQLTTGMTTAQYTIGPVEIRLETGAAVAAFANGGADGFTQLSNKELAIRWNNGANPTKIAFIFALPADLDDTADLVAHFLGAIVKAGADEADSPVLSVEAYFSVPAADPAADVDCGGESGEFLVAANANWQEKTLAIAAADVPAHPSQLTLIVNPKDGELPADDFVMQIPWLEATRQILTA